MKHMVYFFSRPWDLREDTHRLAQRFKYAADHLDTIFTQTCDARALQGGAICEHAALHRKIADKLFAIAKEIEEA